ncbi:hypothetical protein M408DRAFT_170374 [Serendipita vermifera MAFF 305830]|uniref:Uncharacterized protein n=1 Tax=Serendipita vermifera MAFF 305830 TaxID=933852 RepID=A0A0C3AKR0_SERVB|nr:hypothetical protein M408DRAFT_170374 [Serendipita vermifera MAFF 305830]
MRATMKNDNLKRQIIFSSGHACISFYSYPFHLSGPTHRVPFIHFMLTRAHNHRAESRPERRVNPSKKVTSPSSHHSRLRFCSCFIRPFKSLAFLLCVSSSSPVFTREKHHIYMVVVRV